MLEALCDHLVEKPALDLDEMAVFLWDKFALQTTKSSISRALKSKGWSKKTARVKARERNLDLRDEYHQFISDFKSNHLVYVDESGCDKRIGFRRTGWSPLGTAPVQVSKFHRDQRYHNLPAYAQDGIVLSRVFQGSTDASVFEDIIKQLLQHCAIDSDYRSSKKPICQQRREQFCEFLSYARRTSDLSKWKRTGSVDAKVAITVPVLLRAQQLVLSKTLEIPRGYCTNTEVFRYSVT